MRSFVPTTLVASAALFSAAQGVTITKPAAGETVDASKGFDIVWEYDSSDPTDWEIELGNPSPGPLLATDVKPVSASSGQTSTYTYNVKPTSLADGSYKVILDPRNAGSPGSSLPESGEFTVGSGGSGTTTTTTTSSTSTSPGTTTTSTSTPPTTTPSTPTSTGTGTTSVTGTPSGSVIPPVSVSHTVTSASVISSTIISGTHSTVVPQSTVFQTTVVPPGSSTPTGTASPTTTGVQTGAAVAVDAGVGSAVLMALLPAFLL